MIIVLLILSAVGLAAIGLVLAKAKELHDWGYDWGYSFFLALGGSK